MQYRAIPKDDDALRLALIRLAKKYGRYGYRMIAELLRVEGWHLNHKRAMRPVMPAHGLARARM